MTVTIVQDWPTVPPPSADDPPIVIPPGWRWTVANWPPGRWSRWRRYAGEFLSTLDAPVTVEAIRGAELAAYDLVRSEGGDA
jgi:hypothetical protein